SIFGIEASRSLAPAVFLPVDSQAQAGPAPGCVRQGLRLFSEEVAAKGRITGCQALPSLRAPAGRTAKSLSLPAGVFLHPDGGSLSSRLSALLFFLRGHAFYPVRVSS